jgi:hypothetical protein
MRLNKQIYETFIVLDEYGNKVPGLSLTSNTYINGLTSSVSASITEPTSSVYVISLIPSLTGHWLVEIGDGSNYLVATYFVENEYDTDDIYPLAKAMYNIDTGKWIMKDNKLTLYENNTTNILYQFNLFDINDNPSITGVCTRIPV